MNVYGTSLLLLLLLLLLSFDPFLIDDILHFRAPSSYSFFLCSTEQ